MRVGRTLRETGPAALIPAAWLVAALGVRGTTENRPIVVMHVVMILVMGLFVVASWNEMQRGVLRVWRLTILAGVPVVATGLIGLVTTAQTIAAVSLYGWMVLPIPALLYTARKSDRNAVYGGSAFLCAVGFALALVSFPLAGIGLVAIGQTVSILAAISAG